VDRLEPPETDKQQGGIHAKFFVWDHRGCDAGGSRGLRETVLQFTRGAVRATRERATVRLIPAEAAIPRY
jgi:hypothetical protein